MDPFPLPLLRFFILCFLFSFCLGVSSSLRCTANTKKICSVFSCLSKWHGIFLYYRTPFTFLALYIQRGCTLYKFSCFIKMLSAPCSRLIYTYVDGNSNLDMLHTYLIKNKHSTMVRPHSSDLTNPS